MLLATAITYHFFAPSLLKGYTDYLLNFGFMEHCLMAYIFEDFFSDENFFISPLFTPDHILAQYPPCFIFCGEEDPIYDQSLYLAYNLYRLKVI